MESNRETTPTEFDLQRLEARVEQLIETILSLKDENLSLRARQSDLTAERAELIEKTELAKNRIEAMITRLKSMELNL